MYATLKATRFGSKTHDKRYFQRNYFTPRFRLEDIREDCYRKHEHIKHGYRQQRVVIIRS